jgi:hypothetical protein
MKPREWGRQALPRRLQLAKGHAVLVRHHRPASPAKAYQLEVPPKIEPRPKKGSQARQDPRSRAISPVAILVVSDTSGRPRSTDVYFPHMRIGQPEQRGNVALVEAKRLLE